MEIVFIRLVALKCYVNKRNNVYHQVKFFITPPPPFPLPPFFLFAEIFNKRPGRLFEALQYDISFQIPKNPKIKKILKNLVICP